MKITLILDYTISYDTSIQSNTYLEISFTFERDKRNDIVSDYRDFIMFTIVFVVLMENEKVFSSLK